MDILTRVYSRIIQSESDTYPRVSKQNEEYINSQLWMIYDTYQTYPKLKVYIRRLINFELFGGKFYPLRDEPEMRHEFYNLIGDLHDYLHPHIDEEDWSDSEDERCHAERNWESLGDYILGYILLRDIHFTDDCLSDYNYTLIGRINEWRLADHYHQQIYTYKSKRKIKWGRKTVIYEIPFRKTNPDFLLQFAKYDENLMIKSHHLYLEDKIYKNLSKSDKGFVKDFVEKRKLEHIQIFQESKDGVFPFFPKDMVHLINEMIYPELDQTKIVSKIVNECEEKYWKFICDVENDKSKSIQEEYNNFRADIIFLVNYLLDSLEEVKGKWIYGEDEFRQEIMKILSLFFSLEEFKVVKYFNKVDTLFQKKFQSRQDVIKQALNWKKRGEDVDWFIKILTEKI